MEAPFFSVIIPTYARPQPLQSCLTAVAQLDYPRDRFEVIVVNDGDPSFSYNALAPYDETINIRLISQDRKGPASARNTGACNAIGDFLVFTDDDCQPSKDWLRSLAAQCDRYKRHAIGGDVINALPNNLFSTASRLHSDAAYAYFNRQHEQSTFFTACNFAVPRGLYQELGGFDPQFSSAAGEDREFCDRWLREGHRMVYIPEAQVYHAHSLTLPKFLKQHFNYGRGALLFRQTRSQDKTVALVKTDLKFYTHLLLYPFHCAPFYRAVVLSLLLFSCNVAKTVGFFWERAYQQIRHLQLRPFAAEKRTAVRRLSRLR